MEEVSELVWSRLACRRFEWRDCRMGRPLDCTVLRQTLGMGCGVCSVPVPSRWACYCVVQLVESSGTCQDGPTNRVQWAPEKPARGELGRRHPGRLSGKARI